MVVKLGDLRKALANLPDNTDLFMDEGDLRFAEVRIHQVLPGTPEHAPAILLEMGQVWNEEFNLDARLDAQLRQ